VTQDEGEFRVQVHVDGHVGVLEWSGATNFDTLSRAVSLAADDALLGHGLVRVEVALPAHDHMALRAVHMAGFRREGRRRQALRLPDGSLADVLLYARLVDDVAYGPGGFSGVMNSVLPRTRTIGHVVFRDAEGRVLLMQTQYKDDWELPGGIVEPHESPRVGAEREVAEELGLQVRLGVPVLVDWMPPLLGWDDALEFLYDGEMLSPAQIAALVPHEGEIKAIHWVEPTDVGAHMTPLAARRVALVLSGDGPHFTEHGHPLV